MHVGDSDADLRITRTGVSVVDGRAIQSMMQLIKESIFIYLYSIYIVFDFYMLNLFDPCCVHYTMVQPVLFYADSKQNTRSIIAQLE